MNIAFCINNAYVDKIAVVMISLFQNNPETDFDIYVFSSDLSDKSISFLNKLHLCYKKFRLHPIHVDPQRFNKLKLNIEYISLETYYRYIIADLLPQVDKILYLDGDLVVNGAITDFYNQDIDTVYLSAVPDLYIKKLKYNEKIGCPNYVNAGVLLMNLKNMRKDKLGDRLIQKTIELQGQIQYQDQDVLNIVCADRIQLTDSIYNFTMENIKQEKNKIKSSVIIHYTGEKKPWAKKKVRLSYIWEKYNNILKRYKNRRIKVGLLIDEFFGGAGTGYGGYGCLAREYIAKYIPNEDIKIDVLLGRGKKKLVATKFHEDNVDLYKLPKFHFASRWWLKRQNYDVYLSIELTSDFVLKHETNPNKKLILWIQDPRPQYEWDEIKTMDLMPEPCYYNQKIYDLVHEWYQKKRITFISQARCLHQKAIDLYNLQKDVNIRYVANPVEIDNSFNVKDYKKENKIIFLGRLEDVKRGWLFCEIAKRLPEYDFHVLGKANISKENNLTIFEKYRNLPNLHFEGLVVGEKKKQFLKDAKILINTSIHEALPVSFLEALSYGVCLVSNRNPDNLTSQFGVWTGDVLGNGFDKIDLYVNAVKKIMENETMRQKIAEEARNYVCQNHSVHQFIKILRKTIIDEV